MNGDHAYPAIFRGIIEECAQRAMDEDVEGVPDWERFRVISDELGAFLHILARGTKRRRVVELSGNSGAGSTIIWLAAALNEFQGDVYASETNPKRLMKLQNILTRASLSPRVAIHDYDPVYAYMEEGSVIAPPVVSETESEPVQFDMVVVSLKDSDWPNRLSFGWDMLCRHGFMVLTDTIQAGESADIKIGEFFDSHPASVTGLLIGEGVLVALKLPESVTVDTETDEEEFPVSIALPDEVLTGEQAGKVLAELEAENRKPGSRFWAIPPVTGRFLWMVLRAMGARNALEIGMSSGYSGIWLASALKDSSVDTGHEVSLTTIDNDPEKINLATDSFDRAGVSDIVKILEGDAIEVIRSLDEKYDFIFLDCDKEYYFELLDVILRKLRRGGILIADNVISHADEMKNYLDAVKNHPNLASITVPLGSGEEMTMLL